MTVYFIGAGPGDPELITVKGQRLIRSCPVILYAGSLVPAALAAADTLAYLDALDRAVAAQLEQGAGLEETQRRVRLPAFRAWVGQGAVHARNVHKQYLAREADWLVAPR